MRACAVCAGNARVCTVVLRALSVCVLWCMWSLFRAWGSGASESLGRGWQNAPSPTLRVDTFPPRKDHIHPQHHLPLFHQPFRGRELPRIPGLHCSAQSVQAPPLSSLLDLELRRTEKKTQRLSARMENNLRQMHQKHMPRISPPGGHPATREIPQKRR